MTANLTDGDVNGDLNGDEGEAWGGGMRGESRVTTNYPVTSLGNALYTLFMTESHHVERVAWWCVCACVCV